MATPDQKNDKPKYPTITRAELAGGYFNKHVAFVIKVPAGHEIKRRYTDFEWLRHLLRAYYPGAFIPPIPPKLPVAMWPQGYLLMRKRELQQFLQRLEVIPYLKKEVVTIFFLTNHGGSFDKARKKYEKTHPKPSDKSIFEKLVATFPKIHSTSTPTDMNKRCSESKILINESIKQLEIMLNSTQQFIKINSECCNILKEFQNAFDGLIQIEYKGLNINNNNYFANKRVDISPHLEQWKLYKKEEITNMNVYYLPTLNRALNDLRVIREIILTRERIQNEYADAKKRADIWLGMNNDKSSAKQVRSSDLAKKHREIQKEEDLRNLKCFVEKLVLGQLNVVFCANTRRWKKSSTLFANKHLVALEKVLGSWKSLANKVLVNKDKTHKYITVETIKDDDDNDMDDNKTGTGVAVPVDNPNDDDNDDVDDDVDDDALRKQREQEEAERLRKEKEELEKKRKAFEEAERLRKQKEKEEEEERLRKEKEKERLRKEKEAKDKASKAKMAAMFADADDDNNKKNKNINDDNEFPWDD